MSHSLRSQGSTPSMSLTITSPPRAVSFSSQPPPPLSFSSSSTTTTANNSVPFTDRRQLQRQRGRQSPSAPQNKRYGYEYASNKAVTALPPSPPRSLYSAPRHRERRSSFASASPFPLLSFTSSPAAGTQRVGRGASSHSNLVTDTPPYTHGFSPERGVALTQPIRISRNQSLSAPVTASPQNVQRPGSPIPDFVTRGSTSLSSLDKHDADTNSSPSFSGKQVASSLASQDCIVISRQSPTLFLPMTSSPAIPFPTSLIDPSLSQEEREAQRKEDEIALRIDAERARAMRWRLVAGMLLARANGKARPLSRRVCAGGNATRNSSIHSANGLESPNPCKTTDGMGNTGSRSYIRSGLSQVVAVEV